MVLTSEYLQQRLDLLPEARRYLVGFSGGLDSHVLLRALTRLNLNIPVVAVHINHSIHAQSDQWQEHCGGVVNTLETDFLSRKVDANPPPGESLEAWARKKRYEAFSSVMEEGDILLLAHHQDDQIETFFLQLLRGSGPHGLAAMPMIKHFSVGLLARPLLEVKRQELELYARENLLQWMEDPSNQDHGYDRNYLRHEIIPLIRKRWPGYAGSLSRSISLQSDASELLNASAKDDFSYVCYQNSSDLSIQKLHELSDNRLRNLLRFWIKHTGFTLPSFQKIRQIIDTVLTAASDRSPRVDWGDVEVRRYRDRLMIMSSQTKQDNTALYQWDFKQALTLPIGVLSAEKIMGQGFHVDMGSVEIRFRQGGEMLKPMGQHTTTLKKYFQEEGIPPWLRGQVPLVYDNNDLLIAVSDLCVTEQHHVDDHVEGWVLSLIPALGKS